RARAHGRNADKLRGRRVPLDIRGAPQRRPGLPPPPRHPVDARPPRVRSTALRRVPRPRDAAHPPPAPRRWLPVHPQAAARALRRGAAVTSERVIASGRDAEMIDLGDGRLLRRPRVPRSLAGEAVVMRVARAAGYPVPEVFEVRPDGLVVERVQGPTMLE